MKTNNLISNILSDATEKVVPEVGMGATVCFWTDRHAGTITKVTPKTITVREDKAIRLDKAGMSDQQDYRYEQDPKGTLYTFRLTKRGWREGKYGTSLIIGRRAEYYDFSF